MDTNTQADQLAHALAPSLPRILALPEKPDEDWERAFRLENPLVTVAVVGELRRLASTDPHLTGSASNGAGHPGSVDGAQLERRLQASLAGPANPSRALLWALLYDPAAGLPELLLEDDVQPLRAAPGPLRRLRTANRAWLTRQFVALFLNAMIAGVIVLTLWRARHLDWTAWSQVGSVKIFSIWALSFLPGWLFVRFLGQRAASLWWEFVLTLHRLGVDLPQYLPEPPMATEAHRVWLADGGAPLSRAGTIYQEKFDAYYGKSVSRIGADQNPTVRPETLFPVFLHTAVLAVAWTAVLWNTSFVDNPHTAADMLKFAFLGAYSFVLQMFMRRFFQSDLKASAYASAVVRYGVVSILVVVLHQLAVFNGHPNDEAIVAFIVGFFPLVGMQALQRVAAALLRTAVPSLSPAYPLSQLDGLNVWYEARLLEEGIEDMENLATANLVDVILHTHVPVGRLIDWVDQAVLFTHLDRTERGWVENRRATKAKRQLAGTAAVPPTDSAEAPHTVREGSRVRHALRNCGIRTATDLLKAYGTAPGSPACAGPPPKELGESTNLRPLVTILTREPNLNLVWNWQLGAAGRRLPPPPAAPG